jgi:MoaA/NifB/PqqE/SkfB family radical SAM enzyme
VSAAETAAPPALARLPREESYGLNVRELEQRRETLSSTPRLVTLGTHNSCNAKCVFCLEGQYPRFDLPLYKRFFEGKMGHFIRQAEKVTFTGFGEVLWVPDAVPFLDYLNETIPETWKIFTTNGTPLRPDVVERLLKSRYVIQLSLHASHAKLHEELTLLPGAFEQIVGSARELMRVRRERGLGDRLHMVIVNVVTRMNASDLPKLVRLAWELGVPELQCQYVTMFAKEHIGMSCFFDQAAANAAIEAAEAELAAIKASADPEQFAHFSVRLPPKFGQRKEGEHRGFCADPWEMVYVEGQGPVLPCCNWGVHAGNLEKGDDLDALWNSGFYRMLRRGIASGDPHPWCKACVKYTGWNVDSLLSHLTNRPDQQRRLLDEIEKRGLADVKALRPAVDAAEAVMPR